MTAQQKSKYQKLADDDKIRHEKQMAERSEKGYFTMHDNTRSTDPQHRHLLKKPKGASEDEENRPKRACGAYNYFVSEYLSQHKPTTEVKITKIMSQAAEHWNKMSDQSKKKFVDMHEEDLKRFKQQQSDFEKLGYFMMPDGSKSTDEKNAPPKRRLRKASKSLTSEDEVQKGTRKPLKKAVSAK